MSAMASVDCAPATASSSRRRDIVGELAQARAMQQALLPSKQDLARIEARLPLSIASHYEPCERLGGDIWGIREIADGKLLVYSADFCGHGVSAALHTFRLDALVKGANANRLPDVSRWMALFNEFLCETLPVGQFATMFAAILDTGNQNLQFACAAAPPGLYCSSQTHTREGFEVLEGHGLPLGISRDASYPIQTRDFSPGSRLFLFSDALVESPDPAAPAFTTDRLIDLVNAAWSSGGPAEAVDASLAQLRRSVPMGLTDDLTIIAIGHEDIDSPSTAAVTVEAKGAVVRTELPANVIVVADDAADIDDVVGQLNAFGFSFALVASLQHLWKAAGGAAVSDLTLIGERVRGDEMQAFLVATRDQFRWSATRVVVLTRHLTEQTRRDLLLAGAYCLVQVPTADKAIIRAIRAAKLEAGASDQILNYVATHKSAIGRIVDGTFIIRTIQEAQKLSTMLAAAYPAPERVAAGIWELLSNAIEHGNLGITYEEKSKLLELGELEEEINRRLFNPMYADRTAKVKLKVTDKQIRLRVEDAGAGFNWRHYIDAPIPGDAPNGRGIFIARHMSFDDVRYFGCGNCVEAVVEL